MHQYPSFRGTFAQLSVIPAKAGTRGSDGMRSSPAARSIFSRPRFHRKRRVYGSPPSRGWRIDGRFPLTLGEHRRPERM